MEYIFPTHQRVTLFRILFFLKSRLFLAIVVIVKSKLIHQNSMNYIFMRNSQHFMNLNWYMARSGYILFSYGVGIIIVEITIK